MIITCISLLLGAYPLETLKGNRPNPPLAAVVGPVIVAHRGGSAEGVENSLSIFKAAQKNGADWLEVDVRMAEDKTLWVIHDATLDRCCTRNGRVAKLRRGQLKDVKLTNGESLPSLMDVLMGLPEARLFLDLKVEPGREKHFAKALLEVLRRAKASHRVLAGMRSQKLLWAVFDEEPALPLLYGLDDSQAFLDLVGLPVVGVAIEKSLAVKAMRELPGGIAIWVYTIETEAEATAMIELGLHGIITDIPKALVSVMRAPPSWLIGDEP